MQQGLQSSRLHAPDDGLDDAQPARVAVVNGWASSVDSVIAARRPQALRQLVLYGPDGLPVLSDDHERLIGWITHADLTRALAKRVSASSGEIAQGTLAGAGASDDPAAQRLEPPTPIRGYQLVEIAITDTSAARGRRVGEVDWPAGSILAAVIAERRTTVPDPDFVLDAGDRALLLIPTPTTTLIAP